MKKVLIITYYWPPAGGAGVQRVLKLAKYLPQYGWQPIILTIKNPDCPVFDETLLKEIPKDCKIYKTEAIEPFNLYKKLTGKKSSYKIPSDVLTKSKDLSFLEKISKWVRFNLFIPDAKIGWKYFAVKKGKEIVRSEKVDIIFSSAPPPTVALIGKSISKACNIKWIADFRDPWMEIVHYQNVKRSGVTKFIDRRLERSVLNKADVLVTISKDIVNLFKSKVGDKNYSIIPNGFDETDFKQFDIEKNDAFTIAYTGVITKTRVPSVFLKSLSQFLNSEGNPKINFVIAGNTCPEFKEEIKKNNLNEVIEEKGFLPHNESTKILQKADMLLLVIDNVPKNKGFLTGKIFEYLGAKVPIFAVGPIDGDANKIIAESNSGKMVDYHDPEGTYKLLKKMYEDWLNDSFNFKFNVKQYSRQKQAEDLAKIFEEQTK